VSSVDLVGYLAALFGVTAFTPQAWKIIKTRDTSSLSTPMWILQVFAFAGWIVYGVMLRALPIIAPNTVCFLISVFILVMKLVPREAKNKIADAIDPAARAIGTGPS